MFRIEEIMQSEVKRDEIIIKNSIGELIFNKIYDNEMLLLKDVQSKVLGGYLVYSKEIKNNVITLKRNDSTIVELINIKSKVILDLIDRQLLKSFKQFLFIISEERYYKINLIGVKQKSCFELMEKEEDEKVLTCEFELNENKNLTRIGQEMLKAFMDTNVRTWNKVFLSKKERFKTTLCCDEKIITINNFLLKYINNDIEYEQLKYNSKLRNQEGKVM